MSFFALTPNRHVYAFLTTFFCILQVYRHFDENNDYFLKPFFASSSLAAFDEMVPKTSHLSPKGLNFEFVVLFWRSLPKVPNSKSSIGPLEKEVVKKSRRFYPWETYSLLQFQGINLFLLTGKGMKWYKWYKIFWHRIFPPAASSPHPPDARPCHSAPAPPPSHSLLQWILGMTLSFNMHKYEIPGFVFFPGVLRGMPVCALKLPVLLW